MPDSPLRAVSMASYSHAQHAVVEARALKEGWTPSLASRSGRDCGRRQCVRITFLSTFPFASFVLYKKSSDAVMHVLLFSLWSVFQISLSPALIRKQRERQHPRVTVGGLPWVLPLPSELLHCLLHWVVKNVSLITTIPFMISKE